MLVKLAKKQIHSETEPERDNASKGVMRPGQIKALDKSNGVYLVVSEQDERREMRCKAALFDLDRLSVGDKVLVAGENLDDCYIIALLERANQPQKAKLTSQQGGSAEIVRRNGQDHIRVCDKNNQILFEYNTETGKGLLSMPLGDLVLHAPKGNIDLISGKALRVLAHETISVGSAQQVRMSVGANQDARPSHLNLEPDQAVLSGHNLKITGQQGSFLIQEAKYEGQKLSATIAKTKLVGERLETMMIRCIQRARDMFHYVEKLSHLKTGRLRTLVDQDYNLQGGRASITTKEDVKIRGERIHLG